MGEEKGFVIKDKRGSVQAEEAEKVESPPKTEQVAESSGEKYGRPPEMTFSTFILSLSSSAAMSLGGYQDPVSGHVPQNLELARQSIDILGILQEKTKGNLDAEEEKLLDSSLYELRMRYIEAKKAS